MATIPSSSLQLTNTFPLASAPSKPHATKPFHSFTTRAVDPQTPPSEPEPEEPSKSGADPESDSFENRLSQVRLRYRRGTGKKAELRKGRKSKKPEGSSGTGLYLPPVPLKEPVSGGLKVDLGFSPYSERINGRIALLGLSALLLVELATALIYPFLKQIRKLQAIPLGSTSSKVPVDGYISTPFIMKQIVEGGGIFHSFSH